MAIKPDKVIIDTNIWVSFLITNNLKQIDQKIISGEIRLQFSEELLAELLEVIARPKIKKYFSKTATDQLLNLFDDYADFVTVKSKISQCRDPKDDFLLSLALDSKADYLITGDHDLLVIQQFHKTKIVSIAKFLEVL
ncbi:MAG: putative toxin-antitoxin system toxin component, PIN family [Bacteroidota bacterium]